ncbi:MAG: extracellular solute-binding protein [Conexivisphaerales archaeon]
MSGFSSKKRSISTAGAAIIIIVILIIAASVAFYELQPKPQSVTLTLITFSDPANTWMQFAATQFEQQHPGVKINIVAPSFSQYLTSEISAEQTGSTQYDILGFTSTSALSLVNYLVNLSSYITINQTDIPFYQLSFGGLYRNSTTGATEMIGVPYDASTFALFYRTDIFDNATLNSEFQSEYHISLDPHTWTSWQDAIYADNFLVNQTHVVKYGIIVDVAQSHDLIDTFPAIFGWYYAKNSSLNGGTVGGITNYNIMFTGKLGPNGLPMPSFNNSAGVQALEVLYQLVKYDPQPFSEVNYGTIGTEFASGDATGAIMFTPENPTLINSSVYGKYSISLLPGGYAETGTDFLGVSKYSLHKQLAAEFVQFLASPKINAELYYMTGEFPISAQAVSMISSNSTVPQWERTFVVNVYQTATEAWANPPNIPPTYPKLIPHFNQPVYQFLLGDGSPQSAMQALQQAASAWVQDIS